jgi:hypothetical protein
MTKPLVSPLSTNIFHHSGMINVLFTIYLIFGLIFLNPEKVGACFFEDLVGTLPSAGQHQHLADYLQENYIDCDALFQPKLWSSRSNASAPDKRKPVSSFTHTYRNTCFVVIPTAISSQLIQSVSKYGLHITTMKPFS